MFGFIWMIPFFPLAGFLLLALWGSRLSRAGVAVAGIGSVGLSAAAALLTGMQFVIRPPAGGAHIQPLWTWLSVEGFSPAISLYLDALSVVMVCVVTVVAFFILLYSSEHMAREQDYSRFFASMNLFVGAMLLLVLADNLLLLYLGWEGVGLCSYLLIGFRHDDPANVRAANKAFIVTRIGDTALAVGLLLMFVHLGTLNIQDILSSVGRQWAGGPDIAVWAALLVLAGAVGKSAQLPLQTWLPDAMAGPTPVSALIHAATMVAAGVYLIARLHGLFAVVPPVMELIAVIGALTLLTAAASALVQRDIKRVLAYSTISQIGYMFLALGVGAWSAAIFHFMTHACFKALLFLAAGVVITGLGNEHDIYRMGGLRRRLPVAFWTFLIGAASLSALPLVTAGFYSKDLILFAARTSQQGGFWLWAAGLAGAFMTGLYAFRVVFLVFFGKASVDAAEGPGMAVKGSLVTLAALSLASGFLQMPAVMAPVTLFTDFLSSSLPSPRMNMLTYQAEFILFFAAMVFPPAGIYTAWQLYIRRRVETMASIPTPLGTWMHQFWFAGWGFDSLYDAVLVRPVLWAARINRDDFVDLFYTGMAELSSQLAEAVAVTQSGLLRRYALGIVLGAVLSLGLVLII
jgi:NADH-quinone oxidoreductase subunit L